MKRRSALEGKRSRSRSCVRLSSAIAAISLFLVLLPLVAVAQDRVITPLVNFASGIPGTPTPSATSTSTNDPFATPTKTSTWDPWATNSPTYTPTRNPATVVDTPTSSPTPTETATGTLPTMTFTPTNTPVISRAGLVLLSTAYSNAYDRWDGFNWDIHFSSYIGSIVSRDFHKSQLDTLEATGLAALTSDVKYAWLDEDGDRPAMASGLMLSLLAQLGQVNSATGTSGSQSFEAGNLMASVYTVASKTVAKDFSVHAGYLYGLKGLFDQLSPGIIKFNHSKLLYLTTPKLKGFTDDAASVFYTGVSARFLDRNWKFEIWKPFPMAENPVLLNTRIEGLPMAFNLGYERWDHGFAVLGYVSFRFTLLPQTPAF